MIISLVCGEPCCEWYNWRSIDIDTSKYDLFVIDYRIQSWHVIGLTCTNRKENIWKETELSLCEASFSSLVDFLAVVDKPIKRFNNYHVSRNFEKELAELLNSVAEKKKELQNGDKKD